MKPLPMAAAIGTSIRTEFGPCADHVRAVRMKRGRKDIVFLGHAIDQLFAVAVGWL
jgi:hypothetical protein